MKRILYIILLVVQYFPALAQVPTWTEFYMSKSGRYYTLNPYRTPIRAWMAPDSSNFFWGNTDSLGHSLWTSYLRSDIPDTADSQIVFNDGIGIRATMIDSVWVSGDSLNFCIANILYGFPRVAAAATTALWEYDGNGDLRPTASGIAGLWELDGNGDLQPATSGTDEFWEYDVNLDIQPQI